jgi:hypothetical protein
MITMNSYNGKLIKSKNHALAVSLLPLKIADNGILNRMVSALRICDVSQSSQISPVAST